MSATATVLRKSAGVSSDTRCVIRIPVIREGLLERGDFERLGAKVVQAGGTFDYRSVDKGLFPEPTTTSSSLEVSDFSDGLRWKSTTATTVTNKV